MLLHTKNKCDTTAIFGHTFSMSTRTIATAETKRAQLLKRPRYLHLRRRFQRRHQLRSGHPRRPRAPLCHCRSPKESSHCSRVAHTVGQWDRKPENNTSKYDMGAEWMSRS